MPSELDGIKPILLLLFNAALAWWVITTVFKAVGAYTSMRTSQIDGMNERLEDLKTSPEELHQLSQINKNLADISTTLEKVDLGMDLLGQSVADIALLMREAEMRREAAERSETGSGSA